MKKIILSVVLVLSLFTLAACNGDEQVYDINLKFFTNTDIDNQLDDLLDLEEGQKITRPEAPIRQGFEFVDWYKDYNCTELWDFDNDTVGDHSFVLYAKWEPAVYQIIYDWNGGEPTSDDYPTSFEPGDTKVLPIARRTGFTFLAWYLYDDEDGLYTKPGDRGYQTLPDEQYEDLELHAHWEPITVKVSFRANYPGEDGPANPAAQYLDYGEIIDFEELADTAEYEFIGWNTKTDGTGDFYEDGDEFIRTLRMTLYGVWELID